MPNLSHRVERRREIRLKRSHLLENPIEKAVTYKIAIDRDELEKSFRLVWDAYVKVGLQKVDDIGMRFTKYHLLPTTKVFVAIHRPALLDPEPAYEKLKEPGDIVGTLTLVPDTPLGLPMEEVCGSHIAEFRRQGRKPAEVIALAVNPHYRKYNLMMRLYKLMYHYATLKGITDICASVTERHFSFYREILLFTPMGEKKPYSAANQLEVQCHYLDILTAPERYRQVYGAEEFDCDVSAFFLTGGEAFSRPLGEGYPWSEDTIRYFVAEKTRMIDKLSPQELAILRQEYERCHHRFPY